MTAETATGPSLGASALRLPVGLPDLAGFDVQHREPAVAVDPGVDAHDVVQVENLAVLLRRVADDRPSCPSSAAPAADTAASPKEALPRAAAQAAVPRCSWRGRRSAARSRGPYGSGGENRDARRGTPRARRNRTRPAWPRRRSGASRRRQSSRPGRPAQDDPVVVAQQRNQAAPRASSMSCSIVPLLSGPRST